MTPPKNQSEKLIAAFAEDMLKMSDEELLLEFDDSTAEVREIVGAVVARGVRRKPEKIAKKSEKRRPSLNPPSNNTSESRIYASFSHKEEKGVLSARIALSRAKTDKKPTT